MSTPDDTPRSAFSDLLGNALPNRPGHDLFDWGRPSRAFVAKGSLAPNTLSTGVVLWGVGGDMVFAFEDCGSADVLDLGLPEPEGLGLWVWEGRFHTSGPDLDGDYDVVAVGTYRRAEPGEVASVERGECPWRPADWASAEGRAALARGEEEAVATFGPAEPGRDVVAAEPASTSVDGIVSYDLVARNNTPLSDNMVLQFAEGPGDVIFCTAAGEVLRLCADGRIVVRGREVENDDLALVDGLRAFLEGVSRG